MMTRTKCTVAGVLIALLAPYANAQDDITYSNWNASLTGAQDWQVDANWDTAAFPNDPGRVDNDEETIDPVIGANLSVGLGADLDVNVGASDVTVAALRMGGTSGAVTTTISSGAGGQLVFENKELNFDPIPDEMGDEVCAFNCSDALIVSGGVDGATNVISAPIFINDEHVEVDSDGVNESTNDLTIGGPITFEGETPAALSVIPQGVTVTISSPLAVPDINPVPEGDDPIDFWLNRSSDSQGTIVLTGEMSGDGRLELGPPSDAALPLSTIILNGENSMTGDAQIAPGQANIVIGHADAFGDAQVRPGAATGSFGVNLISTDDNLVIDNEMSTPQWVTLKGENSLEWSGLVRQTNTRGWINMLPEGKTFTLSGPQFIDGDTEPDPNPFPQSDKPYTIDGRGETFVTGAIADHAEAVVRRSFRKWGAGAVYLRASMEGSENTYTGETEIDGGNLHFATIDDVAPAEIVSLGGAVGLENGTVTGPDSGAFLGRLNNFASAPQSPQGDLASFRAWDHGGLMLASSESDADLDFTSGALANARDMSVAAPESGMTYTGTITPAESTYRLGGGSGALTLPNANQLTGANDVVVTNGGDFGENRELGMVRVTGANDYTGVTMIEGKFHNTNQDNAAADSNVVATRQFHGTTLAVTSLANGGAPSSIGAASSAAENLVLKGATLKYEGDGDSTDRLFTVGADGATIDASGTGALSFTNTGAVAIDVPEDRMGSLSGFADFDASESTIFNLPNTDDLFPGMEVTDSTGFIDEGATIVEILSPNRVLFSDEIDALDFGDGTISFGPIEHTLTFTGDNGDANTFSPAITDGAGEGNVVNVEKSGPGAWVLDGANSYTGDTTVEEGVLTITDDFLSDDGDVFLSAGAEFNLDFTATDVIDSLFLAGEPLSVGTYGAEGNVDADHQLAEITGDGILLVSTVPVDPIGPGDFNGDGVVDARDYAYWRDNLGGDQDVLNGQGDDNDVVDGGDYEIWRENYGLVPEEGASLGAASAPEPAAALLALLGAAPLALRRASRRK